MSYCLATDCTQPQNSDPRAKFCLACGSELVLQGRYRALRPIGEGGFGRTFLAIDEHCLQRTCVIKQFVPQSKGSGTLKQSALNKAIQLFHQEAVRLHELGEHSQIPTLLAHFEVNNRLYLVQQFIEGENLIQELRRLGNFSEEKIRALLQDILPILQFVHARQVIHRDIKPGNILRRKSDQRIVLIDFGIAKQVTDASLTLGGTKIGTEGFAPMEQWRSGKVYPASDLYSLGATCVFLMTGIRPDQLYDPLSGTWHWREHLASQGVQLSSQLEHILDRLLKDAVSQRYSSAAEVLRDLQPSLALSAIPVVPAYSMPLPNLHSPAQIWLGPRTVKGHMDWVRCLALSAQGHILASGSSDRTVRLWNPLTGAELRQILGHQGSVQAIVISPNGYTVISASSDKSIKIWRTDTGKLLRTLVGHQNWVNALVISPDGLTLASGSEDKTVKIWAVEQGEVLHTLEGHRGGIHALAFSPDGALLVSGSSDHTLKLWETKTGALLQTLTWHTGQVNSVAVSPDGTTLASGSNDGTLKLWRLPTGEHLQTLKDHEDSVTSLAIAPASKLLVSGSRDQTVKVWDFSSGQLLCNLTGSQTSINTVTASADGRLIACGSTSKLIHIWQLASTSKA